MKRIYITFGGRYLDSITDRVVHCAPKFGADEVIVYDDKWLMESDFWPLNSWLWSRKDNHGDEGRGFLYWSWKPFILMDALKRCQPGDVVMYVDGDTYPIADFRALYDECARIGGIMAFQASGKEKALRNSDWNKRDCMVVMGQDEDRYANAAAAVARFMLFQAGPWRGQQFLAEWLTYCVNPVAQTFGASTLGPEREGFREHRTEQAIYTNLCHKYGVKLYREACGFGKDVPQDWDLYPQLFEQVWGDGQKTLEGSRFRNA